MEATSRHGGRGEGTGQLRYIPSYNGFAAFKLPVVHIAVSAKDLYDS